MTTREQASQRVALLEHRLELFRDQGTSTHPRRQQTRAEMIEWLENELVLAREIHTILKETS